MSASAKGAITSGLSKEEIQANEKRLKFKNMKVRLSMAFFMGGIIVFIVHMGHFYCSLMACSMLYMMYFEILNVNENKELLTKSHMRYIQWATLMVFQFMSLPNLVIKRSTLDEMTQEETIGQLIFFKYHFLISFILVMLLIIFMVINLVCIGNFQYQIKTWLKSILLAIIFGYTGSSFIYTIHQGYFWFLMEVMAVVFNDAMAYFFGFFLGKTPLIKLSPKKTWEGFFGGVVGSFVVCFFLARSLSTIKFMICPQDNVSLSLFEQIDCEVPYVFAPQPYTFDLGPLGTHTYSLAPAQFHTLIIALFASLVAPFGGFLASGFKRAFKIKDFADTIPGHGGFTDRMDCKVMMGMFIQFYLTQIVYREDVNVELMYSQFKNLDAIDTLKFYNCDLMARNLNNSKEQLLTPNLSAMHNRNNSRTPVVNKWQRKPSKENALITSYYEDLEEDEKYAQLSTKLNSKSRIRTCLFRLKRKMIVQPTIDFIITIVTGFVINIHLMIALAIAYERMRWNILSYSQAIIPLISLSVLLLVICLVSLIILMLDFFDKGCLAWNRDSFGILLQQVTFCISLMLTFVNFYQYLSWFERGVQPKNESLLLAQAEENPMTLVSCFTPMLIFIGLLMLKMIFFRVKRFMLNIILSICLVILVIVLHYKVDSPTYMYYPSVFVDSPVAIALLAFAGSQIMTVVYQKDPAKILIHGYDRKVKTAFTIFAAGSTIVYVIGFMILVHLIENEIDNMKEVKHLYAAVLIETITYVVTQMEVVGCVVLDIVFEQFYFDLIISGKPKSGRFSQIYNRRMQLNQVCEDEARRHEAFELADQQLTYKSPQQMNMMMARQKVKVSVNPTKPQRDIQKPLLNIQGHNDEDLPQTH